MKKVSMFLAVAVFGTLKSFAQEAAAAATEAATEVAAVANEAAAAAIDAETEIAGETMHQVLMQKFLEGGWAWMLPVLVCLVIGLAVAIERMLYLSFANINTKKFVAQFEETLNGQGVEAAKELCRNTRGPVASIYYQGLDRYEQGMDAVEKAVVSYGSVQTGQMDQIQAAGDISPTVVAGGIKVASLTTLMGLIAAVILQLFYNYIISKIDNLVNAMEDASITLVDILTAYNKK